MTFVDVVVPVALCAAIGYVTNWLAIKMLFWPREEKRVLGMRVPFTPGLFVRRQSDFSTSVGALVERQFLTGEDLHSSVMNLIERGKIDEILSGTNPFVRNSVKKYFDKSTPESFRRDCRRIAVLTRRSRVVSRAVADNVASMDVVDVEAMVMGIAEREARSITWLGAVLGAVIGTLQILV